MRAEQVTPAPARHSCWMMLRSAILTPRFAAEWQKGDVPSAFDRSGKLALVAGAGASLSTWADFTVFSNKTPEHVTSFIIDQDVLISTKLADLGPGYIPPANGLLTFNIGFFRCHYLQLQRREFEHAASHNQNGNSSSGSSGADGSAV